MINEKKLVATAAVLSVVWAVTAETVPLWDGGAVPKAAELKQLAGTEFSVIKRNEPQVDGYNWLHGVALCWHKGRLWASYGTNRGEENTPTEEMHARASDDGGRTWGPVQIVAKGGDGCGVSHGALASKDGELWCFAGTFSNKCSFVHTRAFTLDEASGTWTMDLPTEARWEYSCRAGEASSFNGGETLNPTTAEGRTAYDAIGYSKLNSGAYIYPVGEKQPNAWGLYNFHGPVRELCKSHFINPYVSSADVVEIDPPGGAASESYITRGGSVDIVWEWTRCAARHATQKWNNLWDIGVRLMCEAGGND